MPQGGNGHDYLISKEIIPAGKTLGTLLKNSERSQVPRSCPAHIPTLPQGSLVSMHPQMLHSEMFSAPVIIQHVSN